jgi:hypothetical protein
MGVVVVLLLAAYSTKMILEAKHQKELETADQKRVKEIDAMEEELSHRTYTISQMEREITGLSKQNDKLMSMLERLPDDALASKDMSAPTDESKESVEFLDINLKRVVEVALGKEDPTAEDMLRLRALSAKESKISMLGGIEYAINLEELDLSRNNIVNIESLKNLNNLKKVDLNRNKIVDISSLSGLKNLRSFVISYNQIKDFSVLNNFSELEEFNAGGKTLPTDISAVYNLRSLKTLWLHSIPVHDVQRIFNLKNLETLTLVICGIKDVSGIERLEKLKYANLQYNKIEDPRPILEVQNIETAYIKGNPVSEKVLQTFNQEINEIKAGHDNTPEARRAAIKAAEIWLTLVDKELYSRSWIETSEWFRSQIQKSEWIERLNTHRKPLGILKSRQVKSSQFKTRGGNGYVVVYFQVSFEKWSGFEQVTVDDQKDGTWRVIGYYFSNSMEGLET